LLEDAPVSVIPAENGEVAIQMLRERNYDLVLMDMQMPVVDGLAATRALRQDPKCKDLPIVAMTANAMAGDREKCLEAGMNDHLAKPIDPDKLFEALLRWIPPRSASVPAAVAPPKTPTSDSGHLEIPGVDTHTALKRTGGNRQRYESFLRRFAETQAGAVQEIHAALNANDSATAQRTAHSLKGAAANLGADTIATAAASTEIAIKTNNNVEPALAELERVLTKTIAAIGQVLPAAAPEPTASSGNGDPSAVLQPLSRLKQLLEADDSEAADFIVESQASFSAVLSSAEIESLTRLVGDFDYEGALRTVSGIADRLSLKLE
jgi:two-component system sensor histidine kinase/response regulator